MAGKVTRSTGDYDASVPASVVLLASFLIGASLLVVATHARLAGFLSRGSVVLAALPLSAAVLLAIYVFGEDSYRANGTSRWEAYRSPGGALGPMFVLSVALMTLCAALLVYAGMRRRERLFRLTACACGITSMLLLPATTMGFSLN